ncbi:MAG: hypothetical protein ACM3Q2_00290 [Syntrophothermus sp.]
MKELQAFFEVPVEFRCFSNLNSAKESIKLSKPDLILISSRFLLDSGVEVLKQLSAAPVIVLCEADNFSNIFKGTSSRAYFITRPFEIEKIAEMVEEAYTFWLYSTHLSL